MNKFLKAIIFLIILISISVGVFFILTKKKYTSKIEILNPEMDREIISEEPIVAKEKTARQEAVRIPQAFVSPPIKRLPSSLAAYSSVLPKKSCL